MPLGDIRKTVPQQRLPTPSPKAWAVPWKLPSLVRMRPCVPEPSTA
jgi:hypothetical protein